MATVNNNDQDGDVLIVSIPFTLDGVSFTANTQLRWVSKSINGCTCNGKNWNYIVNGYADKEKIDGVDIITISGAFVVEQTFRTDIPVKPISFRESQELQLKRDNRIGIAPKDTTPGHRGKDGYFLINGNGFKG